MACISTSFLSHGWKISHFVFVTSYFIDKETVAWTSVVAQWLRIHLPIQGTQVQALVQEDPTYCGATKPVYHNY